MVSDCAVHRHRYDLVQWPVSRSVQNVDLLESIQAYPVLPWDEEFHDSKEQGRSTWQKRLLKGIPSMGQAIDLDGKYL